MERSISSAMIRVGILVLAGLLFLEVLLKVLFWMGMDPQAWPTWAIMGFSLVHALIVLGAALLAIILALITLKGRLRWQILLLVALCAFVYVIYAQVAAMGIRVGQGGALVISRPGAATQGAVAPQAALALGLALLSQIARLLLGFGVVAVVIAGLLRLRKGTGQRPETGLAASGRQGEALSTPTLEGGLERLGDRVESLETTLMDRSHS